MIIMVYYSFFFGLLWFLFCDFNLMIQKRKVLEGDVHESDP